MPGARASAIRVRLGQGQAIKNRALTIANTARDPRGARRELTGGVGVKVNDRPGASRANLLDERAASESGIEDPASTPCSRPGHGDERIDERMPFHERPHDLARGKHDFPIRLLPPDRFQASRGDEHIADPVGTGKEEGKGRKQKVEDRRRKTE